MRFIFKNIVLFLFLLNFVYPLHDIFVKNKTQINFKNDSAEAKDIKSDVKSRKSLFAAGLSSILPGTGQFYLGNNMAGSIYMVVEASLWLTRDHYLYEATLSSEAYKQYARDYWSFPKWIRDYHNPSMLEVNIGINENTIEYESAFVPEPDDIYNDFLISVAGDDSLYFHLLWDQGHSAEFDYDGTIISTTDDVNFKTI